MKMVSCIVKSYVIIIIAKKSAEEITFFFFLSLYVDQKLFSQKECNLIKITRYNINISWLF